MKIGHLPLEIKCYFPENTWDTEINNLSDLQSVLSQFNEKKQRSIVHHIAYCKHEDLDKSLKKLCQNSLDIFFIEPDRNKRISTLLQYHYSNTDSPFQNWLNAKLEIEFDFLAKSVKSLDEMQIYLKDSLFPAELKSKFIALLIADPKKDEHCLAGLYVLQLTSQPLNHPIGEPQILFFKRYATHENKHIREYGESAIRELLTQQNLSTELLFFICQGTRTATRDLARNIFKKRILSLNQKERIHWLIHITSNFSKSWANTKLTNEMRGLLNQSKTQSEINRFLSPLTTDDQLFLIIQGLNLLENASGSQINRFKKHLQNLFKAGVKKLFFQSEKIDYMKSIIFSQTSKSFKLDLIEMIKLEIEKISNVTEKITTLLLLQNAGHYFLNLYSITKIDNELKKLDPSNRIKTLNSLIKKFNRQTQTVKYFENMLSDEASTSSDLKVIEEMIYQVIYNKTTDETLNALLNSIEMLSKPDQAKLYDRLKSEEMEGLGKDITLSIFNSKLQNEEDISSRLKILLHAARTNCFLSLIDIKKRNQLSYFFKTEFFKLKIASLAELNLFCNKFTPEERIRLLERLASFQENQPLRAIAFQALHNEFKSLEDKINHFDNESLHELQKIAADAIHICTIDIYLKKDELFKKTTLTKTVALINTYFSDSKHCIADSVTSILRILTAQNVHTYYDAFWQHEEIQATFGNLINVLLLKIDMLLDNNADLTWSNFADLYSIFVNSNVMNTCRPPNETFSQRLALHMEKLFLVNKNVNATEALIILDGITGISQSSKPLLMTNVELFDHLIEKALPLLKNLETEPCRMFTNYRLKKRGLAADIMNLLRTTSNPELQRHAAALTSIINESVFNFHALFDKFDHQQVREDGKSLWELQSYLKNLELMYVDNNPRGLSFLLENFTGQILSIFKTGRIAFHIEDIKKFLNKITRIVIDITNPNVQASLSRLCMEAVTEPGANELTPEMALDLLWINMVLTVNAKKDVISYTIQQQELLFKKATGLKLNPTTARRFFEIRTLKWHGKENFNRYPNLLKQMKEIFNKHFISQTSAPYKYEQICYDQIKRHLPTQIKISLNGTCDQSAREIDIVYKNNNIKIAINIDGSPHFDPITEQPNMNTVFRNKLLSAAGWHVFDINIVEFDAISSLNNLKQTCAHISHQMQQMISPDEEKTYHPRHRKK